MTSEPGPCDLDLADLAEVRRRVVDPVLAALFRPGELESVDVVVGDSHEGVAGWPAAGPSMSSHRRSAST